MTLRDRAPADLWGAQQSADADRHTMKALGVPSPTLMERASLCVSHEIVALRVDPSLPVLILVGPGNNGGDGLAVARQLHGWGVDVVAVRVTDKHNDAVQQQLRLAQAMGVAVLDTLPKAASGPRLVVDAMLGTGSRGAPRGGVADALRWQRAIAGPRVAIDVPSGVDVDTGAVADDAFEADLTVTFVRSKPGLHVTPGRRNAGRVIVADIGIVAPPGAAARVSLTDPAAIADGVLALPPGRHKNDRGHVAVVGGSEETPGAAILTATAALRGSAGLATIVTASPAVRDQLVASRPELMVAAPGDDPILPRATALAVGPGLTDPADQRRLDRLWSDDGRPALWDASALDHVPLHGTPAGPRVVTPHPGEAARILSRAEPNAGWSSKGIQANRLEAAASLARHTAAVAVLKGAGSIIAAPDGRLEIAVTGGPALATAGSGDVLAGLGAALLARGFDAWDAARFAVHLHGIAGDIADQRYPGCIAMDIADAIGPAMTAPMLRQAVPAWPGFRRG